MDAPVDLDKLQAEINGHYWWHTIDLGQGLQTPGSKNASVMAKEFATTFDTISLSGKSVLDVGTWNGAFAVESARRGAYKVVGLDMQLGTTHSYVAEKHLKWFGELPSYQ